MKILYLENHKVFAQTVTRHFLAAHEVVVVSTVAEAKAAIGNSAYDVVLADYDIEDSKGDVFVAHCRSSNPTLPVIAVSSHDAGNAALTAAGAMAVCGKMEFDAIEQVMQSVLPASGEPEAAANDVTNGITFDDIADYLYLNRAKNLPADAAAEALDALIACFSDKRKEAQQTHRDWLSSGERDKVRIALEMNAAFPFATRGELAAILRDIEAKWPDLKQKCEKAAERWQ